ncbi:MAG: Hsp20/alpha crystallin family protein [Acidiphilium sp.]|nr:Hsp20/alpha crystallin family protein [Acidiphilium sp.]MDD4936715.1 Hsp20/alpha crystallin family protein [Acidiphilium sp.]
MTTSDSRTWMWSEALDVLARADRMQRQMFQPRRPAEVRQSCWEPPADVLETDYEVIVITALPGVDPATITTTIEGGALEIFGKRVLPPQLRTATIHRLELPQGCFRRRLHLPSGTYDDVRCTSTNGCLIVTLRKQTLAR